MNYEIKDEHLLLSKEEIRQRKLKTGIPQGAQAFERDILDDIIRWENDAIIAQVEEGCHTEKCSGFS